MLDMEPHAQFLLIVSPAEAGVSHGAAESSEQALIDIASAGALDTFGILMPAHKEVRLRQ